MVKRFSGIGRFAFAATLLLAAGCDNPVGQDDDEHIDEIASVQIEDLSGGVIATFHGDHWDLTGGADALHLHPGEEEDVRIVFIGEDGDRFELPTEGAEHTLRVSIGDTAILSYEPHGDHGAFVALAEGETSVTVQVFHGSHPDWQTTALAVEVVDHPAH